MTGTSLIDQVGAMGIVDALRAENSQLEDYMNIGEQKNKLVEKLESGYRAQGTTVPRETIEEGVAQWFHNRLVFQDVHLPWYFALYIMRDRWLKPAAFCVTLAIVAIVSALSLSSYLHRQSLVGAAFDITESLNTARLLSEYSTQQKQRLAPATDYLALRVQASNLLVGIDQQQIELNYAIQAEASKRRADIEAAIVPDLSVIEDRIRRLAELVKTKNEVIDSELEYNKQLADFTRLKASSDVANFSVLQQLISRIDSMLINPNTSGPDLRKSVQQLAAKLETASTVVRIKNESIAVAEQTLSRLILEDEKAKVRALADDIVRSANNLDIPSGADMELLHYYDLLSRTKLQMLINPDNTEDNGFDREFSNGGGVAYYMIVQARDENNKSIPLKLQSVETGREKFTKVFAVRVSVERQQVLREDKVADGIINDKLAGTKPVGRLTFELEPGFSAEYILEW